MVVQIDRSNKAKQKGNEGHQEEQCRVFGAYCPATKKGFVTRSRPVCSNSFATHRETYRTGSVFYSDMWDAYSGIANLTVHPPCQVLREP